MISVQHCEQFLKWLNDICFKKITQAGTSTVIRCAKCGKIETTKCNVALSATIDVLNDIGEELTLKIGDELLKELLRQDVLSLDENTLAEKLLFSENDVFLVKNSSSYRKN